VVLEEDCRFERLHAPRVAFGALRVEPPPAPGTELPVLEADRIGPGVTIEVGAGRWLIRGDVEIPPEARVESDLVVTGRCRIRRGAVVAGSVKSHKTLVLEDDVQILGSTVSEGDIGTGRNCHLHGPVVSEREVRMATGTVVGRPDALTTVSALDLTVAPGVVVHGTVWAHRRGRVTDWESPRHAITRGAA
jgi:predicted acyltransferase (DUF342 family)